MLFAVDNDIIDIWHRILDILQYHSEVAVQRVLY